MIRIKIDRPLDVLLVEDNDDDIFFTIEAFKDNKLLINLQIVNDGEAALKFVNKESPYENRIIPNLILLDLNLPKVNGMEVLKSIKENDELKMVPVVILTSSSSDEDILSSYEHHANSYLQKPVTFDQFRNLIEQLENFWFVIVKLPQKEDINYFYDNY